MVHTGQQCLSLAILGWDNDSYSLCIGQQHLAQVWGPFPSGDLAFWLCNMSLLNTDSYSLGPFDL